MGYLEKNLLPGETVDYRAHLHPIIFLQSAVFGLVGLGFVIFGRAVHYLSSEFAITNKHVVIKVGFIHRKTLEMALTKIETIRVDQSVLGRVLNYGTIVVTGTGGTNEPFAAIANPLEFRRQVQARTSG